MGAAGGGDAGRLPHLRRRGRDRRRCDAGAPAPRQPRSRTNPQAIPNRLDGGPHDAFERDALKHLRAKPDDPYYRFEDNKGRLVLRYATARVMQESCVQCHNSHPDSPKTNWKKGDVRGVLELIRPLDNDEKQMRDGLGSAFVLVGCVSAALLALSTLILILGNRRRLSSPTRAPAP